jgi:hypothetical protein
VGQLVRRALRKRVTPQGFERGFGLPLGLARFHPSLNVAEGDILYDPRKEQLIFGNGEDNPHLLPQRLRVARQKALSQHQDLSFVRD